MFDLLTRLFYIIFLLRLSYLRSVSFCPSRCLAHTHIHIGTRSTRTFPREKSRSNVYYCTLVTRDIALQNCTLYRIILLLSPIRPSSLQDVPVISSADSWTSFPTVIALFLTASPSTVTRIYRSAARTALPIPVPWSRSSRSRKRRNDSWNSRTSLPARHRNDNHLPNNGPRCSKIDVSHDKQ